MKALLAKLAKLATDMRAMHKLAVTEDRGFTPEERTTWDAMLADFEDTEQRIKDAEQMEQLSNVPTGPNGLPVLDDEDEQRATPLTSIEHRASDAYSAAYDQFLRNGSGSLDQEQRALLVNHQASMEVRAQQIATDAAGGFTVPQGFAGSITERMADFSGLYGAAQGSGGPTLLRTASGNNIPFPTNDDTANSGILLAEGTQVSEQDTVFAERTLGAYMFSSKLIRVSLQLLQDEAVNLQSYLGNILGKRLGRGAAPYFANGTGTAQPTGLATAATDNALNKSAAAGYSHTLLLDFEHSLDPAYRGNAEWVFNDTTLKALKALLDTNARPLWLPGESSIAHGGAGPSLMGYGYIIDQSFDSFVTGGNYMAFGDLSEFIIREVLGINLFRFNEKYMDYLQIGWMGYARWDSNLIDVSAVVTDVAVA
jgi:HK97 family phage major capsid protein